MKASFSNGQASRRRKSTIRLIGLLALLSLLIIQFIPVDRSVPEVVEADTFYAIQDPDVDIATLLHAACDDCHAYTTEYPQYAYFAPVSFWLQGHIKAGRKKLNFSTWGDLNPAERRHALEECVEVMEDKRMPLGSYTWTHEEARLTEVQEQTLLEYFRQELQR